MLWHCLPNGGWRVRLGCCCANSSFLLLLQTEERIREEEERAQQALEAAAAAALEQARQLQVGGAGLCSGRPAMKPGHAAATVPYTQCTMARWLCGCERAATCIIFSASYPFCVFVWSGRKRKRKRQRSGGSGSSSKQRRRQRCPPSRRQTRASRC
jgi:hypothetical protein